RPAAMSSRAAARSSSPSRSRAGSRPLLPRPRQARPWRPRSRRLPSRRCPRRRHRLFRQGRSRHRRAYGADPDRRQGARRADGAYRGDPGRHCLDAAGSLSIQNGGMQLRQAAATARRALLKDAADRLDAKPGDLSVGDGVVTAPSGKSLSYGELAGGPDFALKLDKEAPVKAPQNHQVVGRPIVRLDIPDKVTGRFTYMQDFRVPDMLHGRVVRPPAIGATLTHVDEG